jgi:hypothetical protein
MFLQYLDRLARDVRARDARGQAAVLGQVVEGQRDLEARLGCRRAQGQSRGGQRQEQTCEFQV